MGALGLCGLRPILLVLLISCGHGQPIFTSSRIFTNTNDTQVLSASSIGSSSTCSQSLFLLTTNVDVCLAKINKDGTAFMGTCPPGLRGGSVISCVVDACFVLNPTSREIVVVDNNGNILHTFGNNTLVQPVDLAAFTLNSSLVEIIVVESSHTVFQFLVSSLNFSADPISVTPLVTPVAAAPVVGILIRPVTDSTYSLLLAFSGDTSIRQYDLPSLTPSTFGPEFDSIQAISIDVNDYVYVYDSVCSCIYVLSPNGDSIATTIQLPKNQNPRLLTHSKNQLYIVDNIGLVQYSNGMNVSSITTRDVTCLTRPDATISIFSEGGVFPLTYLDTI
jgi:hypothetical protein